LIININFLFKIMWTKSKQLDTRIVFWFIILIMLYDLFQKESKILSSLKFKNNCFQDHSFLHQIQCSLEKIEDDDYSLIDFIKRHKLKFPKSKDVQYNLVGQPLNGQIGQVDIVVEYFKNKTNGFFIEAGAWDGEHLSNTLFLEKELSWTGLLVEANTGIIDSLISKNRKSFIMNSCISTSSHPNIVEFNQAGTGGHIKESKETKDSKSSIECYPLFSMLLAIGQTQIDFLSLDVEGAEESILKAIPWNKIYIELVTIEVNHSDEKEIRRIMKDAGYEVYKEIQERDGDGNILSNIQDIMFVKKK